MKNTVHRFGFKQDRKIDVIVMGRVAVDLYAEQIGSSLAEAKTFRKYLGGCAGNIAVGTARLGLNSMMFSCIGQDEMGEFLKTTLYHEGVDISLLQESSRHLTGLVLLGIKPPRDFPLMFYRNDCADMQIESRFINDNQLKQAKALLITGTGLSTKPMRQTSVEVIQKAKKNQTVVILDLDYRPVLWGVTNIGNGENRFIRDKNISQIYQQILGQCDLIVGTEEEILIAGGKENFNQSLAVIRACTQAPIVVKLGEKGCRVYFDDLDNSLQGKQFSVPVLNVLGAGDGFMAGLLRGLLRGESWETSVTYANACGALVVTRHGCAPAIPYWDELDYFLQHYDTTANIWNSEGLTKLHYRPSVYEKSDVVIKRPNGFDMGVNPIISFDDEPFKGEMSFSSIKLEAGQNFTFNPKFEFAAVLMTGRVIFNFLDQFILCERADYFSKDPIVLHGSINTLSQVEALTDCEILLIETENKLEFEPMLFNESNLLECEHRGKGLLEDSSYRLVKTVFDKRNRPHSNLVLGEIITFQGRWSSSPSHYHSQPEVYHYRFSEPQGYAFGENGQEVLRIQHQDTYKIASNQEHAHCVAPGYALYTLWFIRHQSNNPYFVPTFREEHSWTRDANAMIRVWQP